MAWGAIVPLIGGQLVGSELAMGEPPSEIASFSPFQSSDAYALRRWPNASYSLIDKGEKLSRGLKMVVSVCPCAGLSLLSTAKAGSASRADRNQWMFEAANYVLGEARPDVYMGENAPGLFTSMGRHVARDLIAIARKNGYGVTFMKTDAIEHGSPQRRTRTFYYFWRDSNAPVLEQRKSPRVQASEYLAKMPVTEDSIDEPVVDLQKEPIYHYLRGKFGALWREGGRHDGRKYKDVYVLLTRHQLLRDYVAWVERSGDDEWAKAYSVKAARLFADGKGCYVYPYVFDRDGAYSAVIKKTAATMVHPTLDRTLNVREVAWMMGLPADYPIPPKSKYNLLCQNVPVESARAGTEVAVDFLGGKLKDSGAPVMWYDNLSGKERFGDEAVEAAEMFA